MILPQRTQIYKTDIVDSSRWARFEPRPDDVFVCTPPKSGTTWMQSICGMLIFEDADVNPGMETVSKWIDSKYNDEDEMLATLGAQEHRRYIKTHTPLDGILYDRDCSYIAVHRHPIDVHFSGRKHIENMKSDVLDHLISGDVNETFQRFVNEPHSNTQNEGSTLEIIVHHFKSFSDWQRLENIHLFHYADMLRDLKGSVQRLSSIFGYDYDDELIADFVEAATFTNMKKDAAKYAPAARTDHWKDEAQFFESASCNKWEGVLNEESLASYDMRMGELLTPKERTWLEFGSAG
ncbi:MAG: sulfotransferase domain-containing protein [Paracoccaceae bacterium]